MYYITTPFFYNDPATTEIYTLSLHDALPIYHDRAETQQTGLHDRIICRHALMPLGFEREVDHHDGVLLDDAHQENDADQADHRQILPAQHQRQNGADARRRQRRQNGDGVNVTFIEHAEHDVDGDDRGQDQPRLPGQRS